MFSDLPQQVIDDLILWYNRQAIDDEDEKLLYKLYHDGDFHAWNCLLCGERVVQGNPDCWDDFQGVSSLHPDFASFPGEPETLYTQDCVLRQCNDCRAMGVSKCIGVVKGGYASY